MIWMGVSSGGRERGPVSPAPLRNIAGGLQQRGSEVDVAVED